MDLTKLELRPPDDRQPYHFAAHFRYGRGVGAPVIGILWFDGRPLEGHLTDERGETISADEAAKRYKSPYAGWYFWPVSGAAKVPRIWLGPDRSVIEAVTRAMEFLADQPVPAFDRDESVELIEEHLYSTEPDFPIPFP